MAEFRLFIVRATGFIFLCGYLMAVSGVGFAPQPSPTSEKEHGITLYKSGNFKAAVETLRAVVKNQKKDADAWYFLGLALNRNDEIKEARKAFQNSLKLRPAHAPTHTALAYMDPLTGDTSAALKKAERALQLDAKSAEANYILGLAYLGQDDAPKALAAADETLKLNSRFILALVLKAKASVRMFVDTRAKSLNSKAEKKVEPDSNKTADPSLQRLSDPSEGKFLKVAAASLEEYLKLNTDQAEQSLWRDQLETIQFYAKRFDAQKSKDTLHTINETLRPTILYKEKAKYTESARNAGVQGKIILMCVFADDGQIKHLLAIQSLSYGLTEQAIIAARKIRFTPAIKDGHPISVIGNLEFAFNLY